ncbi:glycosyltransferase [Sinomonas sp.]|uniref:glycosyltransferase n=1 Tax=Sinomonas sp. TaxID=1914986 RepID=UPI002FE087FF
MLIVEPNMTGHRPYYVKMLVGAVVATGGSAVVATRPGEFESDDAAIHLREVSGGFRRVELGEFSLATVARLSSEVSATGTVIPDGDRFALRLAFTGGWRGAGSLSILVMREVAQPASGRGVQAAKTTLRSMLFRRVNSFRNVRLAVLKSPWWTGTSTFPVVLDPITFRGSSAVEERLSAEWELDPSRYWFAVLGAISRRKNVDLIARALAEAEASAIGLLVAGGWDATMGDETTDALARLRASGVPVVIINRRLQDEELDAAVARVDCLVLAHSNEGPSGLLGKAAVAGTRVVAAGARSLEEDLKRLPGLGTWVELNVSALSQAFGKAAKAKRPAPQWDQHANDFARALL